MPKLVYVVTASITADHLLRGQLRTMREQGFDVIVIVSPSSELANVAAREGVTIITIPMAREIDLLRDVVSLWQLYWQLRQLQPDIVNASTPKAGLLGMIAAWLARVPVRIYVLRGLRLETTSGFQEKVLRVAERIAAACAHQVVCVSTSLRNLYAQLGIASENKLIVLGRGSSNGVLVGRFLPSATPSDQIAALRRQLGLLDGVPVIGFVGRLTKDKGIAELVDAFELVLRKLPDTQLLLLGDFEQGDPVPAAVVEQIQSHPQIKHPGFVADTAPYYHLMDILAFPSYREGFPNAPLEAAVAGVPTVGFRATGTVDAVQHGTTGVLVPTGSVEELAKALLELLQNQELRRRYGTAAQKWAIDNFDSQIVWKNWAEFFHSVCMDQAAQQRPAESAL
jgi:glycosyltransferase involved in cell wall biosynthesis